MNKAEALQKIKELEKFIEDFDSKITLDMIKPGALFVWNGSVSGEFIVLICEPDITHPTKKWRIGGVSKNPFSLYNSPIRTTNEMIDYLRNGLRSGNDIKSRDEYKFVKFLEI